MESESEEKKSWGGSRKGAGRKATGKHYHVMSITGTEEDLNIIREKAKAKGKSISRYLIELASFDK